MKRELSFEVCETREDNGAVVSWFVKGAPEHVWITDIGSEEIEKERKNLTGSELKDTGFLVEVGLVDDEFEGFGVIAQCETLEAAKRWVAENLL